MNESSQHDSAEHSSSRNRDHIWYKNIVSMLVLASLTLVGCRDESKQAPGNQQEIKKAQTPTDIYIVQAQKLVFPSWQEKMIAPSMQEEIDKLQDKLSRWDKIAAFTAEEGLAREAMIGTFINILFHLNFVKEHFWRILGSTNLVSTGNASIQDASLQKMIFSLTDPELKKLYEVARPRDNDVDCELKSALYLYFLAQENLVRTGNIETVRLTWGIFIRKSIGLFGWHCWVEYKEKWGAWLVFDPTNAGKIKNEDIFIPYVSIELKIDPENRALFPPVYQERINLNK